jgi:competence protein ComEA
VAVDSSFFKQVAALKSADTNRYANNYKPYKKYNNYNNEADYNKPYEKKEYNNTKGELFAFDPNTATTDEWKRLGIRDKTIATIQHYLEKGGKFHKPEDIKKVYGIFPDQAERLMPYVQIKSVEKNTFVDKNETKYANKPYAETHTKPTFQPKIIDVNTADTTAFIALPGIGSKLANRIVSYREKLGGFYKIEQLGETYGISDSVFQLIKPRLMLNNPVIKQININTADAATLKGNPYIRWNIANAIFQFKQQHGNYNSVADLKKIMLIDEQTFNKISPYLTVQ